MFSAFPNPTTIHPSAKARDLDGFLVSFNNSSSLLAPEFFHFSTSGPNTTIAVQARVIWHLNAHQSPWILPCSIRSNLLTSVIYLFKMQIWSHLPLFKILQRLHNVLGIKLISLEGQILQCGPLWSGHMTFWLKPNFLSLPGFVFQAHLESLAIAQMCYNCNSSPQEFLIWNIPPLPGFLSCLTLLKCHILWDPSTFPELGVFPIVPVILTTLPSPLDCEHFQVLDSDLFIFGSPESSTELDTY